MTVLVDDPLIASMAIRRILPLHESSRRLRALYPECPRVYGVAVMGDLSRRRWWPLADALTTDRLQTMFDLAAEETDSRAAVAHQLAATLAHVVVGRVVPLVVLEGRAWDTGLENLWVHVDSEGAIDWVGVVDPTLRALPDDPCFERGSGDIDRSTREGIVALPSEAALTTWVAHRSHRALAPLFTKLAEISGGAMSVASMWHVVGGAVVAAATQVPLLAGSSEWTSMRRSQSVLDALVGFGLPVRGTSRASAGKVLLN
ncbi:iron reductase [Mycobacterium sp. 1164985.4]|uniref:iron reductase n=1 Tax=Mycobacterium sp. 1164985.4 TaxID=1834069 RepID=UPI0007FFB9A3|nr:iron reductase [Mycobacterium sp. 1164985.4]OBK81339.1 iron reductase [Mycobacterium sp. 1164985.4]